VIVSQLVEAKETETVDKTSISGVDFLIDGQSAMRMDVDQQQLTLGGMS
jgi:hypothetical protein